MLKPCPFCGDSANLQHWAGEVSILCSNCNALSAPFFAENEAAAIAAWNTRANDPAPTLLEAAEYAVGVIGTTNRFDAEQCQIAADQLQAAINAATGGRQ